MLRKERKWENMKIKGAAEHSISEALENEKKAFTARLRNIGVADLKCKIGNVLRTLNERDMPGHRGEALGGYLVHAK